jgi:hypothetical protein
MIKAALAWVVARLKEPSTWAGIAGVVGSMAFLPHAAQDAQLVSAVGAAVASTLAIVVSEPPKS